MKRFFVVLLFAVLSFVTFNSYGDDTAPPTPADVQAVENSSLSDSQSANLMVAKNTALAVCTKKEECDTLMRVTVSIMWQETRAGMFTIGDFDNGPFKRSYGLMQVKLKTALDILYWNSKLRHQYFGDRPFTLGPHLKIVNQGPQTVTEEEIIVLLLTNPQFNVAVASDLLKHLRYVDKLSWAETVRAYNQGYDNRNSVQAMAYFQQYKDGEQSKTVSAVIKPH